MTPLPLRDHPGAEHAQIASLAVQRDIEGAKQALADHITRTTELLLEAQLKAGRTT